MLNKSSWIAVFISALLAVSANAAAAQRGGGNSQCLGPDSSSAQIVDYARHLVSIIETHVDSLRRTLGLSAIDSSKVNLVTAKQTCASAAGAIDTFLNRASSGRKVYVIGAGSGNALRYLVVDTTMTFNEGQRVWVFSSAFTFVGAMSR